MKITLTKKFEAGIRALRKKDVKLTYKVWELIFDILESPFGGLGKPEPLKGAHSGYWSRRIDQEHRVIYKIEANDLYIGSCFGHYTDD